MFFTVALQESSPDVWHARVPELPGAVGLGNRPELALHHAYANALRILTLHLDSEAAHPARRKFLKSLLESAFQSASQAGQTPPGPLGRTGGTPPTKGPPTRLPVAG